MRRGLSILVILSFWLAPLAAIFQASDDSRLPACCRRNGAHHCAMSMEMAAGMAQAASSGVPVLTAPAHCPWLPGSAPASTSPAYALADAAVSLPVLLAQAHSPAAGRAAARLSQVRTRAGRGPPATTLA